MSKSIYAKLSKVMEVVDHIEKRGHNQAQNYDFLMAEDVINEVRQEFVKQGLVLLPAATGIDTLTKQVGDKVSFLTNVHLQYTIGDMETGDNVTLPYVGQGADPNDKGLYKAFTGGFKYFLRTLCMIPTGDDPENDGSPPKGPHNPPQRPPAQQGPRPPVGAPKPPALPLTLPKASENQPTPTGTTPPTVDQLTTLFAERKKRGKPGWDPILDAVTVRGFTQEMVAGKSAAEVEMVLRAFVAVNLTFQQVADLIGKMAAIPARPPKT